MRMDAKRYEEEAGLAAVVWLRLRLFIETVEIIAIVV